MRITPDSHTTYKDPHAIVELELISCRPVHTAVDMSSHMPIFYSPSLIISAVDMLEMISLGGSTKKRQIGGRTLVTQLASMYRTTRTTQILALTWLVQRSLAPPVVGSSFQSQSQPRHLHTQD